MASARGEPVPGISAEGAWARPALSGMNTALYLTLSNESNETLVIVGAESELAERVEMHETTLVTSQSAGGHAGQLMKMQPVATYELGAGDSLTLEPGRHHIMLLGLKRDLLEGERFEVVLRTASGAAIHVNATVALAGPHGYDEHDAHENDAHDHAHSTH